jgi:hypothetical protein
VPQSQQNQAVIGENASPCRCHPDAQRKDPQLHWFATANPSGEVQDADLHEVSYFTFSWQAEAASNGRLKNNCGSFRFASG